MFESALRLHEISNRDFVRHAGYIRHFIDSARLTSFLIRDETAMAMAR